MTDDTIHTCSYYCERPECIKRQRDELRDRLESVLASAPPSAPAGVDDELRVQAALLRTPEFMTQFAPEKFARQLERIAAALASAPPSAPVGVDEAAAIRAFEEHFQASSDDPYFEGELELWLTAWRKALAAQQPAAVDEARSVSSIMDGAVSFVEALAAQQGGVE